VKIASDAIKKRYGKAAYYGGEAMSICSLVSRQAERDPDFDKNFDSNYAKIAPEAVDWVRIQPDTSLIDAFKSR
jgi:hypothetical protein